MKTSRNGQSRPSPSIRLLGGGTEPDPRFTLANERTFLAWMRTALALVAGGIAVEAFTDDLFPAPMRTALALALLVLATLLSTGAVVRWLRVERSLRQQAPLPLPLIAPLLGAGSGFVAAVLAVFLLQR